MPRSSPLIRQPFELVERVVRQVFHYRQKKASTGLADLYPKEARKEMAADVFDR